MTAIFIVLCTVEGLKGNGVNKYGLLENRYRFQFVRQGIAT